MASWNCIKDIRKVGDVMYRICENGVYRDATQQEIEEFKKMTQENQVQGQTLDEKVVDLQEENKMLKECILEMSEIVYGG
jgi:hypothetical protein